MIPAAQNLSLAAEADRRMSGGEKGLCKHKGYLIPVFHKSAVELSPFFTLVLECLAGCHQKSKFLGNGLRVLPNG